MISSLDPVNPPRRLCASADLQEKGTAFVFDVLQYRQKTTAFVLRFDGRVVGYLNRCVHVPAEMDWQPGHFLDMDRTAIMCSIHGATYAPSTGRCVGGPCGRGSLTALQIDERDGEVFWQPSNGVVPAPPPAPQDRPARDTDGNGA